MAEPGSAKISGVADYFCSTEDRYPLTPALFPKGGEGEREPIYVDFNI